jgi:nucleotide-binding universal stress UspA family protein
MKPVELFQTILCPVDFSGNSRHALQYAALLARRTDGRLIALFVEDPLLAAASAGMGVSETTQVQLGRFVERATAPSAFAAGLYLADRRGRTAQGNRRGCPPAPMPAHRHGNEREHRRRQVDGGLHHGARAAQRPGSGTGHSTSHRVRSGFSRLAG